MEVLVWLRAHASIPLSSWDQSCAAAAVERNDLSMLRWLRAQDPPCPWDKHCCWAAVRIGSFSLLQWLRSQQPPCPWDKSCTGQATSRGHLPMLKWLRAQEPPCPWSPHCTIEAARKGHLDILEWLSSQGLTLAGTEYYHAASKGHQHVLRWLHAQHAPVSSIDIGCWGSQVPTPIVMFLADIGFPLPCQHKALIMARQTFCTFHGLLRWCRHAVSDPSLPQDPRLAPSAGVKLCTYHRWFGRPQNAACPSYWESPMGNAKLHRILRFRMGSHHLPVEEGRHFNLPRASRVCNLCNTDALGDERHMLVECPALAALRLQFSSLLLPCSGVMRRLLWAKDQHEVCRYIIACLDRMSSH